MSHPHTRVEVVGYEPAILRALFDYVHLTTDEVWRIVAPERSKRTIERALERLRRCRLIAAAPLMSEEGARSPLVYHLLLAGARALGYERLGSQHYRPARQETLAARSAWIELDLLVRSAGWSLLRTEAEERKALLTYLAYLAEAEHGERYARHTLAGLLPARVSPDLILVTHSEVIPVIIAHPQAGRAFWRMRLKKYARIITRVRVLEIALTTSQQEEASDVLAQSAWTRRYLVLQPSDLPTLLGRLGALRVDEPST